MRKRIVALLCLFVLTSCNNNILQAQEAYPPPTKKLQQSVIVSWYKHGRVTANGERFNPNGLTVAHKSLPFGTKVRFTNPNTGSSVVLRVNDRGPFIKGREFDLTLRAAKILGFVDEGVSKLNVKIFNR